MNKKTHRECINYQMSNIMLCWFIEYNGLKGLNNINHYLDGLEDLNSFSSNNTLDNKNTLNKYEHIRLRVGYWPLWLSWLECCPVDQMVVASVPSQSMYLGCGFNPWPGHIQEGSQSVLLSCIDVSLPFSLSLCLSLSLKAMKKISTGEDK